MDKAQTDTRSTRVFLPLKDDADNKHNSVRKSRERLSGDRLEQQEKNIMMDNLPDNNMCTDFLDTGYISNRFTQSTQLFSKVIFKAIYHINWATIWTNHQTKECNIIIKFFQ